MNQYYKKIDWSQCTTTERYTESNNGNMMNIEIPEEYQDVALQKDTESGNVSEKE